MFGKLGRIIWLKNIIWKYLIFVLLFGTRIGSKQARLFVSYKKQIPFLKSNNVEYCRILLYIWHFGTFLVIFQPFLHAYCTSTLTNKKINSYSFWFDFSDLNQIILCFYSSVFDIILLFMANHVELFALFCFLLRFESPLFWLVLICFRIQTLYIRFDHESNHKNHYSPELNFWMFATCGVGLIVIVIVYFLLNH